MALLLSLFSDQEMNGLGSSPIPSSSVVSSLRSEACSPAASPVLNQCKECSLREWCSDECAAHSFPLDAPWAYGTRFHNLGEYINMLKHYGWA